MAFASPHTKAGRSTYLRYQQTPSEHEHQRQDAAPPVGTETARSMRKGLGEGRAKRLELLQLRENHNWRRDRVMEYIIQRIERSEHRHKSHLPEARRLVQEAVDKIVEDASFVFKGKRLISSRSKDILGELEGKLLRDLADLQIQPQQPKNGSDGRKRCSSGTQLPLLSLPRPEDGSQQEPLAQCSKRSDATNMTAVLEKIDKWQLINAYQTFNAQQAEEQHKNSKAQRVAEYRAFLDRQKKVHDDLQLNTQAELLKIREEQTRAYEQWKADQENRKKMVIKKDQDEKALRLEVIEEKQKQREAEKTNKLVEEKAMNDVYQRLVREEEARKRRRKAEERRRQEVIEEENRKEKEKRDLVAQAVAAEDVRLMEAYARKLEREDEERKTAFSKRLVKMKNLGAKWENEGAGKQQRELQLQQEKSIMQAAMKKELEDQERDRRDREKKLREKKMMADDNLLMSRRHQEEGRAAKEAEQLEIVRVRREAAEAKAKDMHDRMSQRARQREYVTSLKKQMADAHRMRANQDISDKERLLNRQLLEQAESDEGFIEYCEKKLLPALEGSSSTATVRRKSSSIFPVSAIKQPSTASA